jgi:hypothetical protein
VAERPPHNWGEIPEGHEVVAVIDPDWEVTDDGWTCSFTSPKKVCDATAVAILWRGTKRRQRWRYCPEHMYGRWVEDGKVMHWILTKIGSDDE